MRPVCNIVTGYLGAGKTTLLRHVLKHGLSGQRVALVVNEIGDISIDGIALSGLQSVEKAVEFNSGCICCSVDTLDLIYAIEEIIVELKPDLLIIETTGLADPGPVAARIASAGVETDAIITVVDAANFQALAEQEPVLNQQAEAADFILMAKTDLVTPEALAGLTRHLEELNPRALIGHVTHGEPSHALLFAHSAAHFRARSGKQDSEPHSHHGEEVTAVNWQHPGLISRSQLEQVLNQLDPSIYRAKGLVRFSTDDARVFNYVCGRFDYRPVPDAALAGIVSQAVFIGRGVNAMSTALLASMNSCRVQD